MEKENFFPVKDRDNWVVTCNPVCFLRKKNYHKDRNTCVKEKTVHKLIAATIPECCLKASPRFAK